MRLIQLTEAAAGTFVSVRLTPKCNRMLVAWMDLMLIEEPMGGDELHCTLVMDKNKKLAHDPIVFDPPIPVDPSTYHIDLFGQDRNILVLRFECPVLEKYQAKLMKKYGLTSDFGEYAPHITLSKKVQEIKTELEPPTFDLELEKETVEAFSLTYKD
jgi:hypothetical protein